MKKEIFQKIVIPAGVEAKLEGNTLSVKGPEGELKRTFNTKGFEFKIDGKEIILGDKKSRKTEKKMINTNAAHIRNMIKGVQEKFEYQLKVCFNHFPITIDVKDNEAIIKNFLGEKVPRKCKILDGVDVKVNKEIVTITSPDKELAGQTAANFEKSTQIRSKDRRVFQDGIFITNKAGREM